jgi:hypothetical protein
MFFIAIDVLCRGRAGGKTRMTDRDKGKRDVRRAVQQSDVLGFFFERSRMR